MDQPGFNYITDQPIAPRDSNPNPYGSQIFPALQVGSGDLAWKVNKDGMWLGGDKFEDAVFSVSMAGAIVASLLTIKDNNGQTIIDGTGLVSGTNFRTDSLSDTSGRTTQSSTFSDLAGTTMPQFTLARNTKVLIGFACQARFNPIDSDSIMLANIALNIDGTDDSFVSMNDTAILTATTVSTGSRNQSLTNTIVKELSAGDHILKLRFNAYQDVDPSDTFEVTSSSIFYIILGS